MSWPLLLATVCVFGILLAGIVAWSPWNGGEDDAGPGQGGSDIQPRPEQIAPTAPVQFVTPEP
jgi:hypothetical protein